MRKFVLYALAGVLLLIAIAAFYWHGRSTADLTATPAQEADCATPPPPEEKPPAPAGLAMAESCADAAPAAPAAPVK